MVCRVLSEHQTAEEASEAQIEAELSRALHPEGEGGHFLGTDKTVKARTRHI